MNVLFLDTETYSETPIAHGAHRYSEGAEVMLAPYAFNNDDPEVLEFPARGDMEELIDAADVVVGHNFGNFDRVVIRAALGLDIPTAKIFDTMAAAYAHSLPGSLGLLGTIFQIPEDQAKDKEGKKLIHLFCKPRPKNSELRRATKATHPEEWEDFRAYAMRDITSMRVLYEKLPRWNFDMGHPEHEVWQLDQRANDRGIAVDLELAHAAIAAVKERKDLLALRTQELTDGDVMAATQRDKLLVHLLAVYDVDLPDLQADTLERRVNDQSLPAPLRELLAIRLSASSNASAKYRKLVDCTSSDGRLRGTLQYCGAARTGRWAGRLVQPQNLARPDADHDEVDAGIEALKSGVADLVC